MHAVLMTKSHLLMDVFVCGSSVQKTVTKDTRISSAFDKMLYMEDDCPTYDRITVSRMFLAIMPVTKLRL